MPKIDTVDYPQEWPQSDDDLMSNFDHEIDEGVAARMRNEQITANYPGWEFNAQCWFEGGKFRAAVRRYHRLVCTYEADTPSDLMREICADYGDA